MDAVGRARGGSADEADARVKPLLGALRYREARANARRCPVLRVRPLTHTSIPFLLSDCSRMMWRVAFHTNAMFSVLVASVMWQ